jgi:hypothetical protein
VQLISAKIPHILRPTHCKNLQNSMQNGVLQMKELQVPILCTRAEAARLLACSVATIIRLEREGRLFGIRLTNSRSGQVYFRRDDILALVELGTGDVQ